MVSVVVAVRAPDTPVTPDVVVVGVLRVYKTSQGCVCVTTWCTTIGVGTAFPHTAEKPNQFGGIRRIPSTV